MKGSVDTVAVAKHAADRDIAYLITISAGTRVHTAVVHPRFCGDVVALPDVAGRSVANVRAHPEVSLLWPPNDGDGYSLIADGTADAADDGVTIALTRAILHRPASEPSAPGAGDGCVQDCIEL